MKCDGRAEKSHRPTMLKLCCISLLLASCWSAAHAADEASTVRTAFDSDAWLDKAPSFHVQAESKYFGHLVIVADRVPKPSDFEQALAMHVDEEKPSRVDQYEAAWTATRARQSSTLG